MQEQASLCGDDIVYWRAEPSAGRNFGEWKLSADFGWFGS